MIGAYLSMVFLAQAHFSASEVENIFAEGKRAYAQSRFDAACEAFGKLVQHGQANADVYFNLGTSFLAAGRLGEAVLNLELARRQQPSEDIDAQLAVAHAQLVDPIETPRPSSFDSLLGTSPSLWGGAFLWAWGLAFLSLSLRNFVPSPWRGRLARGSVPAFIVAIGLGSALTFHAWTRRNVVEAVIVPEKIQVKPLPDASAPPAFELHAGLKVRVLDRQDGHVRLRLANGLEGWALSEAVVELPSP